MIKTKEEEKEVPKEKTKIAGNSSGYALAKFIALGLQKKKTL